MLRADGKVETLPDLATFSLNLNCLDKSVKASKKCLVTKSNDLNSKLSSFGIAQKDILTTSVEMTKSYTWRNNSNVFEGYLSTTTLFVTVRNIDKLDEIYTELLENRNLDLYGLSYSHSKLDSLKNEAYADALKKAGVLADRLLHEMDNSKKEILKIGNVEISSSVSGVETKAFAKQEESDQESPQKSIAISKGTVEVYASLFIEYLVK